MKIALGSDHFGYELKCVIADRLRELGHEPVDLGCSGTEDEVDYPDVAARLAKEVSAGAYPRGILVCGTGIGMAIAANKVPGVRAACCHDLFSAERARKSNDAQVLTLGAQIVGPSLALTLVERWMESEFQGGRSAPKVAKLKALDAV